MNKSEENSLLEEITKSVEEENNSENEGPIIPIRGELGWSDYVLSQFEDNEVVIIKDSKGKETRYPKVNGLRRLGELLIGEVIESQPTPINVLAGDNYVNSTFLYKVTFKTDRDLKTFSDVGEVLFFDGESKINNIGDVKFAKFPSSIAVTRAEARVYRKALLLNAVAFEELDKRDLKNSDDKDMDSRELISNEQKLMITNLCKRNKIDVNKYINKGLCRDKKSVFRYDNLNQVSFSHAVEMFKQLEEFQRDKVGLTKYITQCDVGV